MYVQDDLSGHIVGVIEINSGKNIQTFTSEMNIDDGIKPLYFTFSGKGRLNFISLSFD